MKDRLADLKARQGQDGDEPSEYDPVLQKDVEGGKKNGGAPSSSSSFLSEFFQQVDKYQQTLRVVKTNIQEIKKHHGTILSSPQPDQRIKEELERLCEQVQDKLHEMKVNLKKVDKNIEEQEKADNRGVNYAELRIKKSQYAALSRELMDVMCEYDNIQSQYKDNCKNRIKRQLHIVNPNKPIMEDSEFDEMLLSDNPSIFTQGIITDTQQAKNSLREIELRHHDIINLENNIKQLHEMFTDVAYFVSSQGEMIDRIEFNVGKTSDHVADAVKETKIALVYRASALKKKIICGVICVVVLGIIALALVLSLQE